MVKPVTTYQCDLGPVANQYSRNLLAQIKNSWHWVDPYGQWHSRVIVQNDYAYDTNGKRTSNLLTDQKGVILWYGRESVDAEARGAIH